MVDAQASPESITRSDASKERRSLLRRFGRKKIHAVAATEQPHPSVTVARSFSPMTLPLYAGLRGACLDATITDTFAALHQAIITHVHKFYSLEQVDKDASQGAIKRATSGLGTPWTQIAVLLSDQTTRLGALHMCIGWTILSRSLFLESTPSNSPGSTFLPPEIVECFQSFSFETGAAMFEADEHPPLNFALLSRWKQISVTLMHATYVSHSFTHFDSRAANIECALKDLEPLLQIYALPKTSDRVNDLREILKTGAKFAFMLFSQPCFWKFDWCGPQHRKTVEPQIGVNLEKGSGESHHNPTEVVIWPTLLRIMDGDGRRISEGAEGHVLGKKIFLTDFS